MHSLNGASTEKEETQHEVINGDNLEELQAGGNEYIDGHQERFRDASYPEAGLLEHEATRDAQIWSTDDEMQQRAQTRATRPRESKFNIDYLIKNCLHKAVACLVDSDISLDAAINTKTRRLNVLLRVCNTSTSAVTGNAIQFI